MGLFGKIKEAKYSEGGVYLTDGVFRLAIEALKLIETRAKKQAFVAEFKVLESSNATRQPGSLCSWMVMMDKEPAMGNIKQFLASMLGVADDQIDESVAEFAVNPDNNKDTGPNGTPAPIKGRIVRCSATNIKTKANRDFTKCKFFVDTDAAGAMKDQVEANKSAAA